MSQGRRTPGWIRHAADLEYRFLDRVRHPEAARVAGVEGVSGPFEQLGKSGYLLVTFKRSGEPVPTPVMFSRRGEKVYVRGEPGPKVQRACRNPRVRIAQCNARGKPRSPVYEAAAHELPPEEHQRAHDILFDGYAPPVRAIESLVDRMPDRNDLSGGQSGGG